jgi:gliding motility-associated-like protein
MNLPIQESKLFIPTVFSPNSNSERNRTFKIVKADSHEDLTSEYLSLELQIFNRYGKRIYKNNNYQSDWDGGNFSDGVYYYILLANGFFRTEKFKGCVTILGGGR